MTAMALGTVDAAVGQRQRRRRVALVTATLVIAVAIALAALLAHNNSVPGPVADQGPAPSLTQQRSPVAGPSTPVAAGTSTPAGPLNGVEALAALRSAITALVDSGAFDPNRAQEAQGRLDDVSQELSKGRPEDFRKKVDEFSQHLTDYLNKGQLTSAGYGLLAERIRDLRAIL
jgi:FIMAH domain